MFARYKMLILLHIFDRGDALDIEVLVSRSNMPVPRPFSFHLLSTVTTIIDKCIREVNGLHMVPHISSGGGCFLTNCAIEEAN